MLVKDQARLDAKQMLDETWAAGYPVDPERIARHLDITVKRLPLGEDISGLLRVDPEFGARIYVNSDDTPQRQQFTIAHELGHYWERSARGQDDFNIVEKRSGDHYDLHEFYADEFAGALLMPEDEVRRLHDEGFSPVRMMLHFGVSAPAVRKRLERLGL